MKKATLLFVIIAALFAALTTAPAAQATPPHSIIAPKTWTYLGSCYAKGGLEAQFFWKRGDASPKYWHEVEVQSFPGTKYIQNAYWHDKAAKWWAPPNYHIFHFRNNLTGNGHWIHARWINRYGASPLHRQCSKWAW